jgi:hypothetical protein
LHPLLVAALKVDDGGVAEVLEGLGSQHRAQTGLAVEHDRRRGVADGGSNPELEKAAADVRRRLEMSVAVLVGVAHVNNDDLFAGGQSAGDLGRPLLGDHLSRLGKHVLQGLHDSILPHSRSVQG